MQYAVRTYTYAQYAVCFSFFRFSILLINLYPVQPYWVLGVNSTMSKNSGSESSAAVGSCVARGAVAAGLLPA